MPLSAARLLQPDSPCRPAWAVFDPIWYLRAYGARLPSGIAYTPAALLDYYLRHGASARHSPSPVFDEDYYLAANPDVAAAVRAGRFASGFDHFCQTGHRCLSGHWLFDDAFYGDFYEDLSLENLDANGIHGRYDHYLRAGQHEQRLAHPLFDGGFYSDQVLAAGQPRRLLAQYGPYTHFLFHLQSDPVELPPSRYFDPQWYAGRYPQCRAAGAAATPGSAIRHYLCATAQDMFDPLPEFSERFYRESNPDVREALARGAISSGYRHFLRTGVFELRQPHPGIDLAFYCAANASVRNDLNTGASRDAFAHLREIGLRDGLRHAPPEQEPAIGERAARELLLLRAESDLAGFARAKLDFTPRGPCGLAVIMTLSGNFALSMRALSALRGYFAGDMELVIVDHGLSDETVEIGCHVTGARIIRPERRTGFARARNLALAETSAEFVLFLDGQAEPGFLAIAAALSRIRSAPDIAAVGGKIIRGHGLLRQAGGIIRRDGSIRGYMHDAPPSAPEANFLREVDFCSGVFLLCRAAFIKALGGFDTEFSYGYYDDADLCLRMAAAGGRILYDPAVIVHHSALDFPSDAARALLRRGQRLFRRKHEPFLATKPDHGMRDPAARTPRKGRAHILFIEDTVPLRRFGSGHVRANDVVHAMAAGGYAVSVFPLAAAPASFLQIHSAFPDDVEVLHDREIGGLAAFLDERRGFYDLIWVCRAHNLSRVLPAFLQAGIDPRDTPFVLDTEALGTLREAGRARLRGMENFDFPARLREELEDAALCQICVAVNGAEAGLLRGLGLPARVLGTMRAPDITPGGFDARENLLFVGAMHGEDSPNCDALRWVAEAILPALEREMDPVPVLDVAGYHAPDVDLRWLAAHPRIRFHGAAVSLRPLYEKARLFIAPTRFAAGTPYKLYEAASHGVPIVATDLLIRQLGWRTGEDILAAPEDDARRFAGEIARLYRDRLLWSRLRNNAAARIERENAPAEFRAAVARIIGDALDREAAPAPGAGIAQDSSVGGERAAGDSVAV